MDAPVVVLMFLGTECPLSKLHAVRLVDLVDRLGAQRTPEVFVLDRRRQIRYRGRIDDRYGVGYAHRQAERSDLRAALDEPIAAGRTVKVPMTEAVGCFIGHSGQLRGTDRSTTEQALCEIPSRRRDLAVLVVRLGRGLCVGGDHCRSGPRRMDTTLERELGIQLFFTTRGR